MNETNIRKAMWFGLSGVFLGLISILNFIDGDLFHEIALFREVIKTGNFPMSDIFSYVPTRNPVVHHEWGTGAILYLITIQQGLGAYGLIVFKYLITVLICGGIYIFAKRQGVSDYAFAFFAFWGVSLGWVGFTTIRAQMFTLMFLIIFVFLVEENRKGKIWPLIVWLPVYTIWVNIHGGFIVGLGLFLLYILEIFFSHFQKENLGKSFAYIRIQLIIFVIMCLLILVNPYGFSYISYIYHAITLDRTPFITEWRPIWEINQFTFIVFCLSIIVLMFIYAQQKQFMILPGTLMLIGAIWLSFRHYRHLSIYSVILMCYSPIFLENIELSKILNKLCLKYKKILCFCFVIVGFLGIYLACYNKFWQLRIPTTLEEYENHKPVYPTGAVNYLRNVNFTGNMMVHFNQGAYVSWNLYPQVKVSMDSRCEVAYLVDQVVENLDFYEGKEGWRETLNKYQTDALLVPIWSPIEKILSQNNLKIPLIWIKIYCDDACSIYMRSDLAKKYPFVDMRGTRIVGTFP